MEVSHENKKSTDAAKGKVGASKLAIEDTDDKIKESGAELDAGKKVAGRDLTKSLYSYNISKCNTFFLPLLCANFISNTNLCYSGAADVSKKTC